MIFLNKCAIKTLPIKNILLTKAKSISISKSGTGVMENASTVYTSEEFFSVFLWNKILRSNKYMYLNGYPKFDGHCSSIMKVFHKDLNLNRLITISLMWDKCAVGWGSMTSKDSDPSHNSLRTLQYARKLVMEWTMSISHVRGFNFLSPFVVKKK